MEGFFGAEERLAVTAFGRVCAEERAVALCVGLMIVVVLVVAGTVFVAGGTCGVVLFAGLVPGVVIGVTDGVVTTAAGVGVTAVVGAGAGFCMALNAKIPPPASTTTAAITTAMIAPECDGGASVSTGRGTEEILARRLRLESFSFLAFGRGSQPSNSVRNCAIVSCLSSGFFDSAFITTRSRESGMYKSGLVC